MMTKRWILFGPEGDEGGGGGGEAPSILEQTFPDSPDIPARFRNKPVSEAIGAYSGYLTKINELTEQNKKLQEQAAAGAGGSEKGSGKKGDAKPEPTPAEIAAQLQEKWNSSIGEFKETGHISPDSMGAVLDSTRGMFTEEDVYDFVRWRQDRMDDYLKVAQKALDELGAGIKADALIDTYNDRGAELFSDEDEIMLNRLVRLRDPHAVKLIYDRFKSAGIAPRAGGDKGGDTPLSQLRRGEIPRHQEVQGFASREEYTKALREARLQFEASGDDAAMRSVHEKLAKSTYHKQKTA
jgi:hypothetical protein